MSSYTVATGKSFGAGVSGISATKQEGNGNAGNANSGNANAGNNAGGGNSNAGNSNGNQAGNNAGNANSGNANNANAKNNATTKLSASSVTAQLGTNSQFALDKAYSVLGTGNIKVGNQTLESLTAEKQANGDNSLNSLKRTTDKAALTLANVSTGTSVSAALDTRLLSKEGRQAIKDDLQRSKNFVVNLKDVITKDSQTYKDLEASYIKQEGMLQVGKEMAGELALLKDKDVTNEQKEAVLTKFVERYKEVTGEDFDFGHL